MGFRFQKRVRGSRQPLEQRRQPHYRDAGRLVAASVDTPSYWSFSAAVSSAGCLPITAKFSAGSQRLLNLTDDLRIDEGVQMCA